MVEKAEEKKKENFPVEIYKAEWSEEKQVSNAVGTLKSTDHLSWVL